MTPEHAWITVKRKEHEEITVTVHVSSFKSPLVVTLGCGDWSKMLSEPGAPVPAHVHFEAVP